MRAEEAVALLGPTLATEQIGGLTVPRLDPVTGGTAVPNRVGAALGFELPSHVSEPEMVSIRQRLDELGHQWRALADGAAITLTFAGHGGGAPHQGF
jgi:hypothetical protein